MANWCLTKQAEEKLLDALRKEGDPQKMVKRSSKERHEWFSSLVGEENAGHLNSLFESKLLLKNQQKGFESFIKNIGGSKQIQKDFLSKVQALDKALTDKEIEQYLGDYISKKLGFDIPEEQFKELSKLSQEVTVKYEAGDIKNMSTASQMDSREWFKGEKNKKRLEYGRAVIALDNYATSLKQQAGKVTLSEALKDPIGTAKRVGGAALDTSKSLSASMDLSAIGNQGFAVLANYKTAPIWFRNSRDSFVNLVRTFGGRPVWDEFRADLVSRPNYIKGLYKRNKVALSVTEEAFPTNLPEKIPVLGRAYKATEVAFNIFQFKNRADIADMFFAQAEKGGLDMADDLKGIGQLVNSLTARGSLGKFEVAGNIINAPFFSLRRQVSLADSLTGYQIGDKGSFARKEGAKAALQQWIFISTVLGIASTLLPGSVETDPRSSDFGSIRYKDTRFKIAQWASYITLAARMLSSSVKSSTSGKITKLNSGEFNSPTYWSLAEDFTTNKFSPFLSGVVQFAKGRDFKGNVPTVGSTIVGMYVPLGIKNMDEVLSNPNSANFLLTSALNLLGLNNTTYPNANIKTQMIPEGAHVTNESFINAVQVYAKALGTDPETAFNRIFTGQKITKVSNGTVMVERMPLKDSQEVKKKAGANNPQMKLDHTIPLQLGGSNDSSNLKLVTTSTWKNYTPVENALGKALKSGKISKDKAQRLIKDFKNGKLSKEQVLKNL